MTHYERDRHNALLSMDKVKIIMFYRKYDLKIPKTEAALWVSVHKSRLAVPFIPEIEKYNSWLWLKKHGYMTGF